MLTINLLPEGARQPGFSPIEQIHRTPLLWVVVGLMAAIPILLGIPMFLRSKQLEGMTAKVETLKPKKAEIDQLQQVLQQLRAQEAAFRGLEKGEGLWSKRLNTLSNMTPNGVWFTELALDQAKGLVIQGAAVSQISPEISVTRLTQDLKADPDFGSAVKDINIESIKRVQEGEFEIVHFTLTCPLIVTSPSR